MDKNSQQKQQKSSFGWGFKRDWIRNTIDYVYTYT